MFDRLQGPRRRATAVVRRDGCLLIVRDRGFRHFSLPGGGVRNGERPEDAAVRELKEETSLDALSVSALPQCSTSDIFNTYHVFLIEAAGEVRLDPIELGEALWWDGQRPLRLFGYVKHVLKQLKWPYINASGILAP
ncbi:MAG: NUDIX domain-containing protein [Chloroflexota bacterium]